MARIRQVKPELRRSRTVGEWPREVRYAWILLLGYLDDEGRGDDDLRLLVADLFPLDRDVTERKLDQWLWLMATSQPGREAPLCRYTVEGMDYLHAVNWDRHQKVHHPTGSKAPHCPVHEGGNSGGQRQPPTKKSRAIPESLPKKSRAIPESLPNDSGTIPPLARSAGSRGLGVKGSRGQGVGFDLGLVDNSQLGDARETSREFDEEIEPRPPVPPPTLEQIAAMHRYLEPRGAA